MVAIYYTATRQRPLGATMALNLLQPPKLLKIFSIKQSTTKKD